MCSHKLNLHKIKLVDINSSWTDPGGRRRRLIAGRCGNARRSGDGETGARRLAAALVGARRVAGERRVGTERARATATDHNRASMRTTPAVTTTTTTTCCASSTNGAVCAAAAATATATVDLVVKAEQIGVEAEHGGVLGPEDEAAQHLDAVGEAVGGPEQLHEMEELVGPERAAAERLYGVEELLYAHLAELGVVAERLDEVQQERVLARLQLVARVQYAHLADVVDGHVLRQLVHERRELDEQADHGAVLELDHVGSGRHWQRGRGRLADHVDENGGDLHVEAAGAAEYVIEGVVGVALVVEYVLDALRVVQQRLDQTQTHAHKLVHEHVVVLVLVLVVWCRWQLWWGCDRAELIEERGEEFARGDGDLERRPVAAVLEHARVGAHELELDVGPLIELAGGEQSHRPVEHERHVDEPLARQRGVQDVDDQRQAAAHGQLFVIESLTRCRHVATTATATAPAAARTVLRLLERCEEVFDDARCDGAQQVVDVSRWGRFQRGGRATTTTTTTTNTRGCGERLVQHAGVDVNAERARIIVVIFAHWLRCWGAGLFVVSVEELERGEQKRHACRIVAKREMRRRRRRRCRWHVCCMLSRRRCRVAAIQVGAQPVELRIVDAYEQVAQMVEVASYGLARMELIRRIELNWIEFVTLNNKEEEGERYCAQNGAWWLEQLIDQTGVDYRVEVDAARREYETRVEHVEELVECIAGRRCDRNRRRSRSRRTSSSRRSRSSVEWQVGWEGRGKYAIQER